VADARAALEYDERQVALSEVGGGGQADRSRSDDDDGQLAHDRSFHRWVSI
jgi:hypothetical protein